MKKNSALARVRGIAVFVVIMALLAAFCGWLWHNREAGKPTELFGYEWMSMRSDEMEPAIPKGSLLLLEKVSETSVSPGEVVVSGRQNGRGGSVYRILEEQEDGNFLAKSDRASSSTQLAEDSITYQVSYTIPLAGAIWDFLLTTHGMVLVIAIPCAFFLVLEVIGLILFTRKSKKGNESAVGFFDGTEDERENFVDVTDRYTGSDAYLQYQDLEEDLPDKLADLEFNPLMEKKHSSGVETVEIPDGNAPLMKMTLNGREIASLPLEGPRNTRIKSDGWRIDISIAPDEEIGK